ncbi:uncharacterized protein J3D65DRAFT_359550 [Phyllosticta citribraziliensis]|uniref:Secreted protein n=1 Tax=Phyllosticta citribraziliensis TaxID=989973 RepID=A0ABR1LP46_9PEZI
MTGGLVLIVSVSVMAVAVADWGRTWGVGPLFVCPSVYLSDRGPTVAGLCLPVVNLPLPGCALPRRFPRAKQVDFQGLAAHLALNPALWQ